MGRGPARHPYPKGVTRPSAWKHKDPFDHARYLPFLRQRAQANFRGEGWEMTFEEWCEFWPTPELWAQRGRGSDDLMMTRLVDTDSWNKYNVVIMERKEHRIAQCKLNIGKKYKPRKPK